MTILRAAVAIREFLDINGEDSCEDMPREYFATMDRSFGRQPDEAEVWEIELMAARIKELQCT